MKLAHYPFDPDLLAAGGILFPQEIEDDPWIAFHGTTSSHEDSIDNRGLTPAALRVTKDEVVSVVAIFESLHWAGRSHGAFAVLKPFSLDHDFATSDSKPIFLAETSLRAATFATQDFAGGETMRALRYAIDDLRDYCHDADLRAAHLRRLKAEYEHLEGTRFYPDFIRETDLYELGKRLRALDDLRSRCWADFENHSHGVVYALRFTPDDAANIEYHQTMGLKAWAPLPSRYIVGKVRVSCDWRPPLFQQAARDRYFRRRSGPGIITAGRGASPSVRLGQETR